MSGVSGIIVITSFNKRKYLKESIESALLQATSFETRIILSDDSSSDGSKEVCKEYARKYPNKIILLEHDEHLGLVPNCYKCLRHAIEIGAEFIIQLDCDDILCCPDYFEKQVMFLREHPDYEVVFSNYHLIDEHRTLKDEITHNLDYSYRKAGIDTESLICNNIEVASGAAVYRSRNLKSFLEEFATDSIVRNFKTQDLPLWLYLSLKGDFAKCNADILGFRNLRESASRSADLEKAEIFAKNVLDIKLLFINKFLNSNKKLIQRAEALYHRKMARHFAKLKPQSYPSYIMQIMQKEPRLLFSKDFWRSLLVFGRNSIKKPRRVRENL